MLWRFDHNCHLRWQHPCKQNSCQIWLLLVHIYDVCQLWIFQAITHSDSPCAWIFMMTLGSNYASKLLKNRDKARWDGTGLGSYFKVIMLDDNLMSNIWFVEVTPFSSQILHCYLVSLKAPNFGLPRPKISRAAVSPRSSPSEAITITSLNQSRDNDNDLKSECTKVYGCNLRLGKPKKQNCSDVFKNHWKHQATTIQLGTWTNLTWTVKQWWILTFQIAEEHLY